MLEVNKSIPTKEFVLSVEGLTVSFDGFKAVNDLSLYVEEQEIRVIIGHLVLFQFGQFFSLEFN